MSSFQGLSSAFLPLTPEQEREKQANIEARTEQYLKSLAPPAAIASPETSTRYEDVGAPIGIGFGGVAEAAPGQSQILPFGIETETLGGPMMVPAGLAYPGMGPGEIPKPPAGLQRPPEEIPDLPGRYDEIRRIGDRAMGAPFIKSKEEAALREQATDIRKDLENLELEPMGFIKDGAAKFAAIGALMLGEYARGASGGKLGNVAADTIMKFADLELKKGLAKQGKLKTLHDGLIRQLGSEMAATNSMRAALARGYATKLQSEYAILQDERASVQMFNSIMQAEKKAAAEMAKELREQRQRLLPKYDDIEDLRKAASNASGTASNLRQAISAIDTMVGNKEKIELDDDDRTAIGDILSSAANLYAQGELNVGQTILSQLSSRVKGAIQLQNAINAIAFGLASQSQSASSISDKDVGIFKNLLANPVLPLNDVRSFLRHLEVKSIANEKYNKLMMTDKYTPNEANAEVRKLMKSEEGIDHDPKFGYLTQFTIKQKSEAGNPEIRALLSEFGTE